ncbi:MAG TPA: hypothetical protein VJA22_00490 [Patescibacteria group bacterium]|nr:hypothetical protein [Patescibacteria group bacterium]
MKRTLLSGTILFLIIFALSSCFGSCQGEPREFFLASENQGDGTDVDDDPNDEISTGGEQEEETSAEADDQSTQETTEKSPDETGGESTGETGGEASSETHNETSQESGATSAWSEESSADPCDTLISLDISVRFEKYFSGNYVYSVDFVNPDLVALRGTVAGGITRDVRLVLEACTGSAELAVFNDFDGDGLWNPKLEAKTLLPIMVGHDALASSLELYLPFVGITSYPGHAIVYLNPDVDTSDEFIARLAQADLVVIDHSTVENFPTSFVQKLRNANGRNLILIYFDPTSAYDLPRSSLDIEKFNYLANTFGFINGIGSVAGYMPGVWRGEYVDILQYWPGSNMVNMTHYVKAIDQSFFSHWAEMHVGYFEALARNLGVDGIFFDNMLWTYHHIPLTNENEISALDANYDTIENELIPVGQGFYQIDRDLQAGLHEFLSFVRQRFNGPLLGNGSNPEYVEQLNGMYFENVVDWSRTYPLFKETVPDGKENISVWNNVLNDASQIQTCRVGVLTATILGGYHSCENFLHDDFYWVDEYAFTLGRRIGDVVWQNDVNLSVHEFGVVIYNSTLSSRALFFTRPMQAFRGTQRPDLNHGGTLMNITLPAQDGVMLKYQ